VHTFIATSEIHMQYKLRMTREQVRAAAAAVAVAGAFAMELADPTPYSRDPHAVQAVHDREQVRATAAAAVAAVGAAVAAMAAVTRASARGLQ
jgi:isopropylmalate/homocitrate/citramalate synthase